MRKEVLIAIVIGSILGLAVAFGVWRANQAFSPKQETQTQQELTPLPEPAQTLTISEPEDGSVVDREKIKVKGRATPEAVLVILTNTQEVIITAQASGEFEQEIELEGGANEITVVAYNEEGAEERQTLTVVYSTEFPQTSGLFVKPTYAQEEATPETSQENDVRNRVREKIENLLKKPRAVIGTLSEISDSTLEIKDRKGDLRMAATGDETVFVRVAKGKRSEIEFKDLVLGDFIIAMGFKNGNDVLEAKRVITFDKSPITKRHAAYGVVQSNEEGTLTIKHPKTNEVWTVETSKGTTVTKKVEGKMQEVDVDEIEVGARVVAAGTPESPPAGGEENTIEAGRIHVIPGRAEGQ